MPVARKLWQPILVAMPASRAPADHAVDVGLAHGARRELAGAAGRGAEQPALGIVAEPRAIEIGLQVAVEVMVGGHVVELAALLVQPDPGAAGLHVDILDSHPFGGGADAGEGVGHERDQRAVAQADRR